MNIATIIVLIIVFTLCVLSLMYTKKNGVACAGNCANCKACDGCHNKL